MTAKPLSWLRRAKCAIGWHYLDAFWDEQGREALIGCRFCPARFRNVRGDWERVVAGGMGGGSRKGGADQ